MEKVFGKNIKLGEYLSSKGGWGSPIHKSKFQNSDRKINFFVKTKNAPLDLHCQIDHNLFSEQGVRKCVGAGGVAVVVVVVRNLGLGKDPKKSVLNSDIDGKTTSEPKE